MSDPPILVTLISSYTYYSFFKQCIQRLETIREPGWQVLALIQGAHVLEDLAHLLHPAVGEGSAVEGLLGSVHEQLEAFLKQLVVKGFLLASAEA